MKRLPDLNDCIKLGYSKGSILRYLPQYQNCVYEWRKLTEQKEMETRKDEINEPATKSLQDIMKEGYNWHNGLCTIVVDLCKRVKDLEDDKKQ